MSGYPKFKRKNRALNLAYNDAVKKCKVMRDAMDTAYELIKLCVLEKRLPKGK